MGLRGRVVGCCLGLALGDALGAPFEFLRSRSIPDPVPAFQRPWLGRPPGTTTDDTAMARNLMRSLTERGGFDADDLVRRHLEWFRSDPPDVGTMIGKVLRRVDRGEDAPDAARALWNERGPEVSAGNGSVMYCAPLGLAYANRPDELTELAPALSALTHFDGRCRTAVLSVTLCAAALARGEAAESSARAALDAVSGLEGGEELEFLVEAVGASRPVDGPDQGFCLFTVGTAFQALVRGGDFETETRSVVALGGDADTNAAVSGALLGARDGVDALPPPRGSRRRPRAARRRKPSSRSLRPRRRSRSAMRLPPPRLRPEGFDRRPTGETAVMEAAQKVARRVDDAQQRRAWLAFPYAVFKKFGDDQAGNLAALISYYGFFSLFPLMLVLVTVLGMVLEGNTKLQEAIQDSALANFPVIGDDISDNVGAIQGSGLTLAIGIALALWAGLGVLKVLQTAMNAIWNVPYRHRPNFLRSLLRAAIMLSVLGVITVGSAVAGSIGAGNDNPLLSVLWVVVSLALNVVLFLLAFRILTTADVSWGDVFPGALIAAIAWTALQALGGYFVRNQLEGASRTYGTFATVIGLLAWMYLGAQVTLLAAEVNVVRKRRLWPRAIVQPPLTDADERALTSYAEQEERRPEQDVRVRIDDPSDTAGRGRR